MRYSHGIVAVHANDLPGFWLCWICALLRVQLLFRVYNRDVHAVDATGFRGQHSHSRTLSAGVSGIEGQRCGNDLAGAALQPKHRLRDTAPIVMIHSKAAALARPKQKPIQITAPPKPAISAKRPRSQSQGPSSSTALVRQTLRRLQCENVNVITHLVGVALS